MYLRLSGGGGGEPVKTGVGGAAATVVGGADEEADSVRSNPNENRSRRPTLACDRGPESRARSIRGISLERLRVARAPEPTGIGAAGWPPAYHSQTAARAASASSARYPPCGFTIRCTACR